MREIGVRRTGSVNRTCTTTWRGCTTVRFGASIHDVHKIVRFFDPLPPCHVQTSADCVPFICFFLTPSSADVMYGSPLAVLIRDQEITEICWRTLHACLLPDRPTKSYGLKVRKNKLWVVGHNHKQYGGEVSSRKCELIAHNVCPVVSSAVHPNY